MIWSGWEYVLAGGPQERKRSLTPRKFPIEDQLKYFNCPDGECLAFFKHGACPRLQKGRPCCFKHTPNNNNNSQRVNSRERNTSNERGGKGKSASPVSHTRNTYPHTQGNAPTRSFTPNPRFSGGVGSGGGCGTCGNIHSGVCRWNKPCYKCGGIHSAKVCQGQYTTVNFGSGDRNRRKSV